MCFWSANLLKHVNSKLTPVCFCEITFRQVPGLACGFSGFCLRCNPQQHWATIIQTVLPAKVFFDLFAEFRSFRTISVVQTLFLFFHLCFSHLYFFSSVNNCFDECWTVFWWKSEGRTPFKLHSRKSHQNDFVTMDHICSRGRYLSGGRDGGQSGTCCVCVSFVFWGVGPWVLTICAMNQKFWKQDWRLISVRKSTSNPVG